MHLTHTLQLLRRLLLRILGAGLLVAALAACGGEVQDQYYDDDTGSPSQGAPLDGGEEEVDDSGNGDY
jgi:hypothetical protein